MPGCGDSCCLSREALAVRSLASGEERVAWICDLSDLLLPWGKRVSGAERETPAPAGAADSDFVAILGRPI